MPRTRPAQALAMGDSKLSSCRIMRLGIGPASSLNRLQPIWPFRGQFCGQLGLYFGAFLCPYVYVFHRRQASYQKEQGHMIGPYC